MSELHQHPAIPAGDMAGVADGRSTGWRCFVAAVQFLTRVPLGGTAAVSAAALRQCPIYFPLVATLIGISTVATLAAGGLFWPVWLAVPLALALEARLTGGFHEDALADFCDAFGGGWTREQTLEILKDSRIGTYGALGLAFGLLLRAGAMIALASDHSILIWGSAIIAAATIGRWVIVLAMVRVAPVPNRESLARDIGSRLTPRDLIKAGLLALPGVLPFVILSPLHAGVAVVALVPVVWWMLTKIERRLGGITGDCLGCLAYVSQVLILLFAAANFDFIARLL